MRGFVIFIALFFSVVIGRAAEPIPNETYLGLPNRGLAEPNPLLESNSKLVDPPPVLQVRENVRVAFDLGLPIGMRVQRRLFETDIWAEVGVGAYIIVPYVSACLRYDGTILRRQRNLFAIRPGISATCILADPNLGIGLDAELIWQHTFNERLTTELGIRVGCTAVFWKDRYEGTTRGGWFTSPTNFPNPMPVPIATLMFSVAF